MKPQVKEWYEMAKIDLDVAIHLNENYKPRPLEIICYHAQQAAEKAIKALILQVDEEYTLPPKVHDLTYLLRQINHHIDVPKSHYDYADTLTPYGVSVRYPNELFLTEAHADRAITCAKEILTWTVKSMSADGEKEDEL